MKCPQCDTEFLDDGGASVTIDGEVMLFCNIFCATSAAKSRGKVAFGHGPALSVDPKWTKRGGHVLLHWQVGGVQVPMLRAGYDTKLDVWWAALEAEREEAVAGRAGTFRGVSSQGKKGEGLDSVLVHIISTLVVRAKLKPWSEIAAPDVCGKCGEKSTNLESRILRFTPGILSPPGKTERHVPDRFVWLCEACRKGPAG